ncbi:MAG TPA: MFS transporter [Burkholderiales bacterium]|nr:MFS transporter [Burkholderiales bacterium]
MSARYGWVVVAAAFTLMFVGFAAAYSFAAFFSAFESEFQALRGHVALVFSVAAFTWFLFGAPGGVLADRFGTRRVALTGIACLTVLLCLASYASSVTALYVTYSIGVGIGVGLTYVPAVGAVQPWFQANRAFASGLAVAGIGAGNIAGPLLATWWIELWGWRGAFRAMAVFVLVLGGVAAALIRNAPSKERRHEGTPLAPALRTSEFWLLYGSLVFACIGTFVPMVHLGQFAQDAGYSRTEGVTLVSLIGLGSLVGRFTIGGVADRLGRRASLAAMYAGLGVMLVVWWAAHAYWVLALFAVVFGACYGGYVALLPTLVMDRFGARSVAGIIGFLYTGAGIGTLIGPWLAGAVYDALGNYDLPILAGAGFSLAAAGCVVVLIQGEAHKARHSG